MVQIIADSYPFEVDHVGGKTVPRKSFGSPRLDQAWRYILAIRNVNKREYAIRYLDELRGIGPEITRIHDAERLISCMAAQAVRMRLHAIWYPQENGTYRPL